MGFLDQSSPIKVLRAGRHGIELQVLMAPGQVIRGENCSLQAIGSKESESDDVIGRGYRLSFHGIPVGSIDPIIQWSGTFRNLWGNPHILIVRCNTPRDFSLTIGEIEKDLSHAIRFYKP
ncbi:MAG: hypothetical protein KA715_14815 [Xanthomonadaceae bacterium]|nr:hypothetical protein [Xanthomonadaceae bacterium]